MQIPDPIPEVRTAIDAAPMAARAHLSALRELIYETANTLPECRIAESLKWGQPSFTTADTKAATPIRIGVTKDGDVAVFTHCQSTAMSDFRALAPSDLRFDGNRALVLDIHTPLPIDAIVPLIRAALTYRV